MLGDIAEKVENVGLCNLCRHSACPGGAGGTSKTPDQLTSRENGSTADSTGRASGMGTGAPVGLELLGVGQPLVSRELSLVTLYLHIALKCLSNFSRSII